MKKYLFPTVGAVILVLLVIVLWATGDESVKNAPPRNDTIVAFGDSLVEGVGSQKGGGFVSLLSARLGTPIINLGVAGDTTGDGLARLEDVREKKPGTVIVLLGGNDALRRAPLETTFGNLERIITTLQKDGAMVVLLGVRGGLLSDPYDAEYQALAERTNALYVENVLKGLIGRPELMFDTIHPNDAGYAIIAERVYEALEPYLE